jgi:hypothetical protein
MAGYMAGMAVMAGYMAGMAVRAVGRTIDGNLAILTLHGTKRRTEFHTTKRRTEIHTTPRHMAVYRPIVGDSAILTLPRTKCHP